MLDRSKLSITEIISHYLQLEKKGRNYWGLCPFHEDTRASLSISEEKNIFKCFSCGVAGDAISFIMRKEKSNFKQALIQAHKILKLPLDNIVDSKFSQEEQSKKQLLKFNEFISQFFEQQLFSPIGKLALNYLTKERKLSIQLIKQMRIGYAPKGKSLFTTIDKLKKSSQEYQFIDNEFLVQAGIFSFESKKKGDSLLLLFQDRITLPVFSSAEEIIGFSSRAVPNSKSEIKYLHSKETLLFRKAQLLYNLPSLEKKQGDSVYLFEGCFDLFAFLLLKPQSKALSLMGRELSEDCIRLLQKKEIKKVVLALDTDRAGVVASLKIIQQMLKACIEPHALELDFQGAKDFSELYCANSNIIIPEPVYFSDWIKSNWKKNINQSAPETELIALNQIVNSLLDVFFFKNENNLIEFRPNLDAQFTINSLNAIFSLYELIKLTTKEQETISAKHKNYLEKINLHFLKSQQKNTNTKDWVISKRKKETASIITDFSALLTLWVELMQIKDSHEIIKLELKNWQSDLLEDYAGWFQGILLPEEKLFLAQLKDNLTIKNSFFSSAKNFKNQNFFDKLWNFFDLYYSLNHLILDKSEKYLKDDNLTSLPLKLDWLKRIELDREELVNKSSDIFNRLLTLEKK